MRSRNLILIGLALVMLVGCATIQPYLDKAKDASGKLAGKALLSVGNLAAKAMNEKSATVADVTPTIKLINVNRPRPYLPLETQFMESNGISPPEIASNVFMLFSRGMKLIELDGSVTCNGEPLTFYGNGVHLLNTQINPGQVYDFVVHGSAEDPIEFSETYQGESIEILEPAPGSSIDLSKGFDLKWTPGSDSSKVVVLSTFMTQIGLQNILPILVFVDDGEARVTPDMLADAITPGQKYLIGESVLQLERQRDEIRYVMSGDGILSLVDSDAITVTTMGEAPAKADPAIPAISATEGVVTVSLGETQSKYNPFAGAIPQIEAIRNIGLSCFNFQGITGGSWEKSTSSTVGNVTTTTTTTKRWGYDFGVPVLTEFANYMADGLMAAASVGLNASEVPKEQFMGTRGYQQMASKQPKSDDKKFFVNARELANFRDFKNIKVRVGGTTSWYYDMMKSSGTDALAECYIDAVRKEPEAGKWDEFVFDISISVEYKTFPMPIVSMGIIPGARAQYTSEMIKIDENTTYQDLLKAFRWEDFMVAYAKTLDEWIAAQKALES